MALSGALWLPKLVKEPTSKVRTYLWACAFGESVLFTLASPIPLLLELKDDAALPPTTTASAAPAEH